ncbi:MAG: putative hydrolase of the superfamily [Solirubrobacteraceae bacterium]|jgi:epoxide hydrolase-like predicted phosphatase|nr:putative hydrolase of the superfamily [Solirubrobacteraceae bacterium]
MTTESRQGLLVDFGGVLTTDVFASFQAFCEEEGLLPDTVRERFMKDPMARELLADLETDKLTEEEFEPKFAAVLEVEPDGLIDRLFAGMRPDQAMLDAVAAAKRAGVRTGLISNSWGHGRYDRSAFPELFDGWVISGEEGMRKPEPAMYRLGAERIGLEPAQCVFVDDLPFNLKPARELGMATVLHRDAKQTIPELEDLLGVGLR